jgi:hypothetical protein
MLNTIKNWIFRPKFKDISEELKSNIMEFINAPIEYNNLTTESHVIQAAFSTLIVEN